jgi:TPR repeat protein
MVTLVAVLLIPERSEPPPQLPPPLQQIEREDVAEAAGAKGPEGTAARRLIADLELRGADPSEYFQEAAKLEASGQIADAYLVYFRAARVEHVPSLLRLGRLNDSAYRRPELDILGEPDLFQAHKWYLRAARAGSLEAQADLENLRQRVERAAAQGDRTAERLALLWN